MQCRICFDSNNPEQMLSPCACSGSQAYIHYDCLTQYIRHYPDGICRVCRQSLQYIPRLERFFFLMVILLVASLWVMTTTHTNAKLLCLLAIGCLFTVYNVHHFTNLRFMIFLFGINLVFLITDGTLFTKLYVLSVFSVLATIYTMCLYIHPIHLLTAVTIMFIGLYTFLLGFAALHTTDSYGVSLFVTMMFLFWNAWIQTHPPLR